jgi:hypothetical protein
LIAAGSPVRLFAIAALVARVVERSWQGVRRVGEVNFLSDTGVLAASLQRMATFRFGEVTGWRGFALAHPQRRHSVATATILVAVIWPVWYPVLVLSAQLIRTSGCRVHAASSSACCRARF